VNCGYCSAMAAREKTEAIRRQILQASDNLLYHKGFNQMSFSDIADASSVPRGNLYYYFKTKEEVLAAVIDHRLSNMKNMLREWETTIDSPLDRLKRYVRIPLNELDNVLRYGCPMGSLNSELGKTQSDLKKISKMQFDVFMSWLQKQFLLLQPDGDAKTLTMHLLVRTQGLALMASIYGDRNLVKWEVESINAWLDSLSHSVISA